MIGSITYAEQDGVCRRYRSQPALLGQGRELTGSRPTWRWYESGIGLANQMVRHRKCHLEDAYSRSWIFVSDCVGRPHLSDDRIRRKERSRPAVRRSQIRKIVWQSGPARSARIQDPANSYASSTPATDGKYVYVTFLDGNRVVVAAYDFNGQQEWIVRPGPFDSPHGFCHSPVLFGDKVLLACWAAEADSLPR